MVSVEVERGGSPIAPGTQDLPVDGGGLGGESLGPLLHPELPDVLELRLLLRHDKQQIRQLRSVRLVVLVSETVMAHRKGSDLPGGGVTQQLMNWSKGIFLLRI